MESRLTPMSDYCARRMTFNEIEALVRRGESETTEFKKTTGQLARAAETICGFLNGRGGVVVIGVSPDKEIMGQTVSDSTLQDVAQCLRRFEPPAPVHIERIALQWSINELLVLRADSSHESRPFTFDGRPYERIGSTTSVMAQEKYQRLLLERAHSSQRWENLPAVCSLDDLDQEEIRKTVRLGIAAGRMSSSTSTEIADVLDRFGLRGQDQVLNAAVVVFGRPMLRQYSQCQLRMARFRGADKTEFLDQRQTNGHALQLLEEASQFLTRHLPVAGRIEPGLFERADAPLFPPVALREALVNAFCHRDYSIVGSSVSLAIYDDRLEVWSDGTLPFGLTVDDLKRDHLSRPRNPLIAEVFYRRGLVERWGRGTQKIVELCVQAGHPEPEFVEQAGAVGVRFLPSGYIAPHRVAHDLTTRQREILQALADKEEATFGDLRSLVAPTVAVRTFRDDLLHLKRLGMIGLHGRGRGASWFLIAAPGGMRQNKAE
jgi:ATP-dependent DNA helicase RecG